MIKRIGKQWGQGGARLIALALLIAAALSSVASADDFYIPPEPLPPGNPGDIIRARPAQAGPPSTRALADAWQVMYRSTDGMGEPNAVTGTVLIPKDSASDGTPLIGFGPGTQGPAFRCAPSRMIAKGAFYEQAALNDMLERGYAVAVTDYEGYKPEPETSYMVGRAMGAALIDAVRAARRLPEAALPANGPVLFRGYSQGGGAAMWAGQMQPAYAPALNLVGVVGGGVPANLGQVGIPLDGQAGFGVFFYALVGQDHAYPELSLAPFLNQTGREAVAEMESGMCVLELLQGLAGQRLADMTDLNPLTGERFARITENTLGETPIPVPVFQYHEEQDGLVAFGQARDLRDDYCVQGVNLTWKTYDTGGESGVIRHINLVYRGNAAANAFIEARLAGETTTPNCDS